MTVSIDGLRSVIYPAPDLAAAKAWWTALTGVEPYFDEPFYVGYSFGGYELGLLPNANAGDGAVGYWGVADVEAALAETVAAGATEHTPVTDVGEGIITATVRTPDGSLVGLIYNPYFKLSGPDQGRCPIPLPGVVRSMYGMMKGMMPR